MFWWEWNPRLDEMIVADNFTEIYSAPNLKKSEDGFALLHPDDKENHTNNVQKIAEEGGSYHSEFRIIRQDNGETVWLEETATAFLDDKGRIQKVLGIAIDITQRKKSKKAARQMINSSKESENRFLTVSRATNDILWWNENLFRVFGYGKENSTSQINFWYKNIHPADCERIISGIKKVINTGQSFWSAEYRFQGGDGFMAYLFDRGYVERDENGNALRMIGGMTDISERKQAEDKLLESKERLAPAQQVANVGSFEWTLQTDKLIMSKQLENIYGADENFNRDFEYWMTFVHFDDALRVRENFQKALEIGEFRSLFRIFSADNELRWLRCHLKVVYDEKNKRSE